MITADSSVVSPSMSHIKALIASRPPWLQRLLIGFSPVWLTFVFVIVIESFCVSVCVCVKVKVFLSLQLQLFSVRKTKVWDMFLLFLLQILKWIHCDISALLSVTFSQTCLKLPRSVCCCHTNTLSCSNILWLIQIRNPVISTQPPQEEVYPGNQTRFYVFEVMK